MSSFVFDPVETSKMRIEAESSQPLHSTSGEQKTETETETDKETETDSSRHVCQTCIACTFE